MIISSSNIILLPSVQYPETVPLIILPVRVVNWILKPGSAKSRSPFTSISPSERRVTFRFFLSSLDGWKFSNASKVPIQFSIMSFSDPLRVGSYPRAILWNIQEALYSPFNPLSAHFCASLSVFFFSAAKFVKY